MIDDDRIALTGGRLSSSGNGVGTDLIIFSNSTNSWHRYNRLTLFRAVVMLIQKGR